MPRRREHVDAGQFFGVFGAALAIRNYKSNYNLAALAGGFVGGKIGGVAPDILEPPTSPNHRSFFHSASCNGGAVIAVGEAFVAWLNKFVQEAEALPEPNNGTINWQKVLALFVAGLIAGFGAGYASHIILDACSPQSLPFC